MKIAILGTGAYGIALAIVLHKNKHSIRMWTKFEEEVESIELCRENKKLLPGIIIPKSVKVSSDIKATLSGVELIIIAVPMNAVREVARQIKNYLVSKQIICIVTKGIEVNTYMRMSEVIKEETATENICMISGPSFASDLAHLEKTGLVIASQHLDLCDIVKEVFENESLFLTVSSDLVGVEICASLKNIFAIIMGMIDTASPSTKATVLTILLNDLRLICEIFGGKLTSIFTYAGIGDFYLTCTNNQSRNYTFGTLLAKGYNKEAALTEMKITTVEGLYSLNAVYDMLRVREIKIKSICELYNILYQKAPVSTLIDNLK